MYIHSTYKLINSNTSVKEYRKELKEISKINLRRSSKFNILAVLGALRATKDINLGQNLGIYIASEYGPINDVYKLMQTINEENNIVMPFDFLNVNSNNVSFYVSQALNAKGKNMLLTSQYLSFEKSLQLAQFELEIDEISDILIGAVDESLDEVKDYEKYVSFGNNQASNDGSCWLYLNNDKSNSLGKITNIQEFSSNKELIDSIKDSYTKISFNQFAQNDETITSKFDSKKVIDQKDFFGCEGALRVLELLEYKGEHLYIAKDVNSNFITIELKV
ncbi:MAG: hypothetical protein HWD90_12085 [Campylobacteraceae bacterium]|nr:hypothetical protein [Campylobacteraceae bacterium]